MSIHSKLASLFKRATRDHYDGFLLDISSSSWSKIHKHARNAVRKAEKSGVVVEVSKDWDSFKAIYPERFKSQLPEQQYYLHQLWLAKKDGKVLAGIVLEEAYPILRYKYAASTEEGKKLQANSLLLWKAVEHYEKDSFKYLILGWCSEDGIEHFKEEFATKYLLVPAEFWSFMDKTQAQRVTIVFEANPNE